MVWVINIGIWPAGHILSEELYTLNLWAGMKIERNLERIEEIEKRKRMLIAICLSLVMAISMLVVTADVLVVAKSNNNSTSNVLSSSGPSVCGATYVAEHCYSGQSSDYRIEINGEIMAYKDGNFMLYYQCGAVNAMHGATLAQGGAWGNANTIFQSLHNAGYMAPSAITIFGHTYHFLWPTNYGQFQSIVPSHLQENSQSGSVTCSISISAGFTLDGATASVKASASITNYLYQSSEQLVQKLPQNVEWSTELNVQGQTSDTFQTMAMIPFNSGYKQFIGYTTMGNITYPTNDPFFPYFPETFEVSGTWITNSPVCVS